MDIFWTCKMKRNKPKPMKLIETPNYAYPEVRVLEIASIILDNIRAVERQNKTMFYLQVRFILERLGFFSLMRTLNDKLNL